MRMRLDGPPAPTWRVELFAGYWFLTAAVALGGVVVAAAVLLIDRAAGRAGVFAALAMSPDPAFGLRQIADIALRALSPGINDPSNAAASIHYLGRVYQALAATPLLPLVVARDGIVVVATERPFVELVDVIEEIAGYVPRTDLRLVESLADVLLTSAAIAIDHGFDDRALLLVVEARALVDPARGEARGARAGERLRALDARADRVVATVAL